MAKKAKKANLPVRAVTLYPRYIHPTLRLIEGDKCPMARSKVEGRAGRKILLADGLCDGCRHFVRKRALFAGFGCSHPQAESEFFNKAKELWEKAYYLAEAEKE